MWRPVQPSARLATVFLAIGLSACSGPAPQAVAEKSNDAAASGHVSSEPITISAAASTKEVIESLADLFRTKMGGEVKVNLGPSSGLASQILAGAPADLFLSANQEWADEIQKAGEAATAARLLTNRLVIVVPTGNPGGVKKPDDLLSDKVKKIALAGEKVPAGMYADQSLEKLGLLKKLTDAGKIVRGQDVRSALSYVERGEAEAGIVYSTDVGSAEGVEQEYAFDSKLHDEIVYVLVLLKHGSENPVAQKFYEFLQSPAADAVYAKSGFSRLSGNPWQK